MERELLDIKYRYEHCSLSYIASRTLINSLIYKDKKISDFFEDSTYFDRILELLEIDFLALNSIVQKEKYIINKKELIANERLISDLIKPIATEFNDDGSFVICNKKFMNSVEFINTIRNKLAHGYYKYDMEAREVLMAIDGCDFWLPYEWLHAFNYIFLYNLDTFLTKGEYHESIVKGDKDFKKIETFKEYQRNLKKMEYLDFKVTLSPKRKYNQFELCQISLMIKEILNKINSHEPFNREINMIKSFCKERNMQFEYIKKPVIGVETSQELKQKFYDIYHKNPEFKEYDVGLQSHYMAQTAINYLNNNDARKELTCGIAYITHYIRYIKEHNLKVSLYDYISENPVMNLMLDKVMWALVLNRFNVLFNYSLEETYNKYLDYEKLDLTLLNEKFNYFEDLELTKVENKQNVILQQLEKKYKDFHKLESSLNNSMFLKLKYGTLKEEIITETEKKLLDVQNDIVQLEFELKEIIIERKKIEETFAKETKYYKNKNIINHIRNAIEHGNFEFYLTDIISAPKNSFIRFTDIYKGKITYVAEINLQDLHTIVRENYSVIGEMFKEKITTYKENSKNLKKVLSN